MDCAQTYAACKINMTNTGPVFICSVGDVKKGGKKHYHFLAAEDNIGGMKF